LRAISAILTVVLFSWTTRAAAAPYDDDAVKAAFLFRFTAYVEWPATATASGEFLIGVLDAQDVAATLARLLSVRKIKSLPARVRLLETPAQAQDVHVVYVGPGYDGDLHELAASLAGRPILLVTDRAGALNAGSAINFMVVDRRVRFEAAPAAAQQAGLKLSSQLLAVAVHVRGAALPHVKECRPSLARPMPDPDAPECRLRLVLR
jgi:hypothetical protein